MKTFTATEAKNRFGEVLDDAMVEPVVITKNGRDVAVLVSMAEYGKRLEDGARRERIRNLHEENISRFEEVFRELAK